MLEKTNVHIRDWSGRSSKDSVAVDYLHNAEAPRINTDSLILSSLEQLYPKKRITIVPEQSCNLLAFAAAGHAIAIPDPEANATEFGPFEWHTYRPPASRLDGSPGVIGKNILFGRYKFSWRSHDFILYLVDGRDGSSPFPAIRNNYIISTTENSTLSLILAAGEYGAALHNEIWVFDQGYWQKDASLWASIQNSHWENVILDPDMKKAIIGDVNRFYNGRATYKKLKVPWKRGLIYHGPPGNGKTISIKATMHMLSERKDPVPTLYVKTLSG
jgi:transitional endoplasmic reticulum ATPase